MAEIIRMPALSDTMTEGILVAWYKKVGDSIAVGDLLAEIETDKAVMEFNSLYKGVLLHIGVEAGAAVAVDKLIAIIGKAGEDVSALLNDDLPTTQSSSPSPAAETTAPSPALSSPSPLAETNPNTSNNEDNRLKASPLAKAMAKESGLDLSSLEGSGEDGRIVKRDIEAALLKQQSPSPSEIPSTHNQASSSPSSAYEDVPLSQMRKTIARRLGESKFTAPHFYLTLEICMDAASALRKQLKSLSQQAISFNDLVVKATAKALTQHPNVNASWLGDKIRYHKEVNMGVAVAIEEGLVVPVIRQAHIKSLGQIASEVRELAQRAKDRKLQGEDMQGNTFTISNLGMFGIEEFTAIINPPDACILAVGAIKPRLVLKEGQVTESQFMKVTLSCDHRVVDGAMGAKFLQTLQQLLEEPMLLLL